VVANLRQTDGRVNTLANPRIRVKNREKAKVHIGEKVPVFTTTSTANVGVASSVSYLETGLKLDVEPNIYLESDVAIKIQLEVSNILEQINVNNTVAYRLGTRNSATTLRLKDGETQVFSGLISDDDRRSTNKVPGLAEFPILGRLFQNPLEQRTKTEIVLLMTPRIVHNIARPETVAALFASGTEANPGAPPIQLAPTQPRALSLAPGAGTPAAAVPKPPGVPPKPEAVATAGPVNLLFAAPSQARVGGEFVVSLGLPAGSEATRARVEIAYDPKVLSAGAGGPQDPGRVVVELAGPGIAGASAPPPSEVRFRVVATAPGATQISMANASAADSRGNAMTANAPSSHSVSIVPAQ
jgi:general secretion pathway protein D